ncbi:hypothetical protein D9M72_501170 [compost metagenome]
MRGVSCSSGSICRSQPCSIVTLLRLRGGAYGHPRRRDDSRNRRRMFAGIGVRHTGQSAPGSRIGILRRYARLSGVLLSWPPLWATHARSIPALDVLCLKLYPSRNGRHSVRVKTEGAITAPNLPGSLVATGQARIDWRNGWDSRHCIGEPID